ncbi:flavodoxin domain-containing protein [Nocardia sp.]|uniref:flavodoxin family protein n=1 Tax=Nocardia sp. TaxID=1821 RepID=UPI0025860EF7|nr:flavodoxin domain-containing protein [Nocardia sp.]
MLVQVVYESIHGNTAAVAEAVADGLAPYATVEIDAVENASAPDLSVDLLVIGAPTHGFGLSWPRSRRGVARREAARDTSSTPDSTGVDTSIGVREWISGASQNCYGLAAAAFCTRPASTSWLPSSAAHGISKRLRRQKCIMIASPAEFFLDTVQGPVSAGELERAYKWGATLAFQHRSIAHTA